MDKIYLGISQNFYNKTNNAIPKNDSNLWAMAAFNTVEWALNEVVEFITSGSAISVGCFRNNWRSKKNFISSQIMGVDFDYGPSVKELDKDTFISRYSFLIYATPSSTKEKPRSRALFALDQAITDPNLYQKLVRRLLARFTEVVDESCTDPARLFYGCDTEDYIQHNVFLPIEILEVLPQHKSEKINKELIVGNIDLDNPEDIKQLKVYSNNVFQKILRDLPNTQVGDRHHAIVNAVTRLVGMEISGYPLNGWKEPFEQTARAILPEGRKHEVDQTLDWAYDNLEPMPLFLPNKEELIIHFNEDKRNGSNINNNNVNSSSDSSNRTSIQQSVIINTKKRLIPDYEFIDLYLDNNTHWLIQDWLIQKDLTIIAGIPQSFKTTLAHDMARAIATGNDFLGQYPVKKSGNVIVVNTEDSKRTAAVHTQMINTAYEDMFPTTVENNGFECVVRFQKELNTVYLTDDYRFSFDNSETIKELEQMIIDVNAVAVIIDPLRDTSNSTDKYFSDVGEKITTYLRPLRDKYGTTFIIVHHANKSEGKMSPNKIYGDTMMISSFETKLLLSRESTMKNEVEVERLFKGDGNRKPVKLIFSEANVPYSVTVEEVDDRDKRITKYLKENGPTKNKELYIAVKEYFTDAKALYNYLKRKKEQFNGNDGVWTLTPDYSKGIK